MKIIYVIFDNIVNIRKEHESGSETDLHDNTKHFENFMQKFDLEQKLLTILVFCLFERNRRLLLDSTGD